MTISQQSVDITKFFYDNTGHKATKQTIHQTISQAKSLLKAGFTHEEIIEGIKWCIEKPPPKGFYSLGWLAYDLNNILTKIKAKKAMEQQEFIPIKKNNVTKEYKKKSKQDIVGEDYNFNIFKGE